MTVPSPLASVERPVTTGGPKSERKSHDGLAAAFEEMIAIGGGSGEAAHVSERSEKGARTGSPVDGSLEELPISTNGDPKERSRAWRPAVKADANANDWIHRAANRVVETLPSGDLDAAAMLQMQSGIMRLAEDAAEATTGGQSGRAEDTHMDVQCCTDELEMALTRSMRVPTSHRDLETARQTVEAAANEPMTRVRATVVSQETHFGPVMVPARARANGPDSSSIRPTSLEERSQGMMRASRLVFDGALMSSEGAGRASLQSGDSSGVDAVDLGRSSHDTPAFCVSAQIGEAIVDSVLEGSGTIAAEHGFEGLVEGGRSWSAAAAPARVLKLTLAPDELGVVTITLRGEGKLLRIEVETERNETAQRIEKERELLIDRLFGAGCRVEELSVVKSATGSGGAADSHSRDRTDDMQSHGSLTGMDKPDGREDGQRRGSHHAGVKGEPVARSSTEAVGKAMAEPRNRQPVMFSSRRV